MRCECWDNLFSPLLIKYAQSKKYGDLSVSCTAITSFL